MSNVQEFKHGKATLSLKIKERYPEDNITVPGTIYDVDTASFEVFFHEPFGTIFGAYPFREIKESPPSTRKYVPSLPSTVSRTPDALMPLARSSYVDIMPKVEKVKEPTFEGGVRNRSYELKLLYPNPVPLAEVRVETSSSEILGIGNAQAGSRFYLILNPLIKEIIAVGLAQGAEFFLPCSQDLMGGYSLFYSPRQLLYIRTASSIDYIFAEDESALLRGTLKYLSELTL